MKKIIFASLFTLLFFVSFNAYAGEQGFYVGGNLGMAMLNDSNLGSLSEADLEYIIEDDLPSGTSGSIELEYDSGFTLGAVCGYDFGSTRVEGELMYQTNDFDKITATIYIPGYDPESASESLDGDVSSLAFMINGYYDFFKDSSIQPYITAGIGLQLVETDTGEYDDDTVFVYQVGAGIAYKISKRFTLDLKYRYMKASDPEFEDYLKLEYSSHMVTTGFRVYF